MILNVHSDTSYLCEPKAKIRAGCHFFLSNNGKDPRNNEAMLNITKRKKNVMSSTAEAEIGALFLNSRQAIPARTTLIEMGHQQPPTPIQVDNTTALGFVGKNITPKATKSTDMICWWMRDRSGQKQFHCYWGPSKGNRADYLTNHFCEAHHRKKRPTNLTPGKELDNLRRSKRQPLHKWFSITSR